METEKCDYSEELGNISLLQLQKKSNSCDPRQNE